MSTEDDIALIRRQEAELVLPVLDEKIAFALGSAIWQRAVDEGLPLVIDIRTWDRQLFFAATAGATADNAEWVRRKVNTVKRFQRASYGLALERGEGVFPEGAGAGAADFVLAGGGFPLRVAGAGVVGALTLSGLPSRKDHALVIDALCDHLGRKRADYALPEA